jgi:hypothetical protein
VSICGICIYTGGAIDIQWNTHALGRHKWPMMDRLMRDQYSPTPVEYTSTHTHTMDWIRAVRYVGAKMSGTKRRNQHVELALRFPWWIEKKVNTESNANLKPNISRGHEENIRTVAAPPVMDGWRAMHPASHLPDQIQSRISSIPASTHIILIMDILCLSWSNATTGERKSYWWENGYLNDVSAWNTQRSTLGKQRVSKNFFTKCFLSCTRQSFVECRIWHSAKIFEKYKNKHPHAVFSENSFFNCRKIT